MMFTQGGKGKKVILMPKGYSHINELYIISKCIEVYEESRTSDKQSFLIAIKCYAMSQIRIFAFVDSLPVTQ